MNAKQFEAAIQKLGWTQARAGQELGKDTRTIRRYISSDLTVPVAVARVIKQCLKEEE